MSRPAHAPVRRCAQAGPMTFLLTDWAVALDVLVATEVVVAAFLPPDELENG